MGLPATLTDIEASVYHGNFEKDMYFVKITFVGIGVYINSFSVMPTKFVDSDARWWVQPPKHRQARGWTPTVDFDKSYGLWSIIEEKAIKAVEQYKKDFVPITKESLDVVLEDISDEPINLDDLPF